MVQNTATTHPEGVHAQTMQDQLRALVREHHGNLLKQIDRLGQVLSSINVPDAGCVDVIAEAKALAHQIKGAGGSIGFQDVSSSATLLDDYLKELVALGPQITPDQMQRSLALFGDLQRTAQGTTPESSTLYSADLSRP